MSYLYPSLKPRTTAGAGFNASSQKSLMVKIFAVGHRKIVDFPALAKNDKLLSFLQKSVAFLPQFNLYQKGRYPPVIRFANATPQADGGQVLRTTKVGGLLYL